MFVIAIANLEQYLTLSSVIPILSNVGSAGKITPPFSPSVTEYNISSTLDTLYSFHASFNSTLFQCSASLSGSVIACDDPTLSSISISATPTVLVISLDVIGDSPSKKTEYTFTLQQQLCSTNGLLPAMTIATNCTITSNLEAFCILQESTDTLALVGDSGAYCTVGYLQYFDAEMSWVNCTGDCLLANGENLYQLVLQSSINASASSIITQLSVSNGFITVD